MSKLVVYIKEECPYSQKQLAEYKKQGLDFKVVDVLKDPSAMKKIKEEYGADKVPVVVEEGRLKFTGFNGGSG